MGPWSMVVTSIVWYIALKWKIHKTFVKFDDNRRDKNAPWNTAPCPAILHTLSYHTSHLITLYLTWSHHTLLLISPYLKPSQVIPYSCHTVIHPSHHTRYLITPYLSDHTMPHLVTPYLTTSHTRTHFTPYITHYHTITHSSPYLTPDHTIFCLTIPYFTLSHYSSHLVTTYAPCHTTTHLWSHHKSHLDNYISHLIPYTSHLVTSHLSVTHNLDISIHNPFHLTVRRHIVTCCDIT